MKPAADLPKTPLKQADPPTAAKGFVQDLEARALANSDFRRVLYTAKFSQVVVMSLLPGEAIGEEVHPLDQFFRIEKGAGVVVLEGLRDEVRDGFAIVVPAGTRHNLINTGTTTMKLYTVYSPPNHRDGAVHHTRADAEADDEKFDRKTTEVV